MDEDVDMGYCDFVAERISADDHESLEGIEVETPSRRRNVDLRFQEESDQLRESEALGGRQMRVKISVKLLDVAFCIPSGRKELGSSLSACETVLNHPGSALVPGLCPFPNVYLPDHGRRLAIECHRINDKMATKSCLSGRH